VRRRVQRLESRQRRRRLPVVTSDRPSCRRAFFRCVVAEVEHIHRRYCLYRRVAKTRTLCSKTYRGRCGMCRLRPSSMYKQLAAYFRVGLLIPEKLHSRVESCNSRVSIETLDFARRWLTAAGQFSTFAFSLPV